MLRIVTRTHYQVHEPVYLILLVTRCTSPVHSNYPDRVADRVVDETARLGQKLNRGAARYLVDLGRALGLVTENMVWTPLAHALSVVSDRTDPLERQLSLSERILVLRTLLEFDGAAICYFARSVLESGRIPREGEDWNTLVSEMMKAVASEYLTFLTDIRARTAVRQLLESRARRPYSGKSGMHQCLFHLQAMSRLGFLALGDGRGRRLYTASDREWRRCDGLRTAIPGVLSLERIAALGDWVDVSEATFHDDLPAVDAGVEAGSLLAALSSLYARVAATGVPLVAISTLVDALQAIYLSRGLTIKRGTLLAELKKAQALSPDDVRIHVDRSGRAAYVKFSDSLAKNVQSGETPIRTHD